MSRNNTREPQDPQQDKTRLDHVSPCVWSQAMMYAATAVVAAAIFVSGNLTGRVAALEAEARTVRETLSSLATDMRWVREALSNNQKDMDKLRPASK